MPILGTYELAGFLTALGISFALARCTLKEGHIAVGFLFERFSAKTQASLMILVNTASLIFWSAAVYYLVIYGRTMMSKGLVSPSAELPLYPFIYFVALGVAGLCLVLFVKLLGSCRQLAGTKTKMREVNT
jgi:TRAP-type C4-dicarboxylate transport system permease small subunit